MKSTMTCWVMALFAMTGWAGINNPPVAGSVAGSAGLLATNGSASGLTGYSLGVPAVATGAAVAVFARSVVVTNLSCAGGVVETPANVAKTFRVDLTNSVTLLHPTGLTYDGQAVKWLLHQGTGAPHTVALDGMFVLPVGTESLSLSTAEGSTDILIGEYDAVSNTVRLTGLLLYPR